MTHLYMLTDEYNQVFGKTLQGIVILVSRVPKETSFLQVPCNIHLRQAMKRANEYGAVEIWMNERV